MNEKEIQDKFNELLKLTLVDKVRIKLYFKMLDIVAILKNGFHISPVVRRIAFQRRRYWIELFICHLINNYEGNMICEEYLQEMYIEFAKKYNLV